MTGRGEAWLTVDVDEMLGGMRKWGTDGGEVERCVDGWGGGREMRKWGSDGEEVERRVHGWKGGRRCVPALREAGV